jgi:hypothetical protein
MEHSEAINSRAAEKYLLGELTVEQRDRFEEHFFVCIECAADVRTGAALVDNARHVLKHEPAPLQTVFVPTRSRQGWFGWLKPAWGFAAAAILLLAVLSYQNLVTIPSLKNSAAQPQMLASFSLVTAGSRGAGPMVIHPPKDRPFSLYVDIPAKGSFPYYTVDAQTESGNRAISVRVSAEQAKDTVQVLVPAGALQSGNSVLVVQGHAGENGPITEVARYPFALQFE